MMTIKIKICGITRAEDAADACELGADLLGFNFIPESKRYINPYAAREIISTLPPFVMSVGVFADEEQHVVNDMTRFLRLDAVQLHGSESPSYCTGVNAPVIKAMRIGAVEDLEGARCYDVPALLLDSKVKGIMGGSGKTFPWHFAAGLCDVKRIFVAGGITPDNVAEAIHTLSPFGIDCASGVEVKPGVKDRGLMEKLIGEAVRAAAGNGEKRSKNDD
jgi:phosphoribosylanthranilate isomerase